MGKWIFKIIYYPIFFTIGICVFGVLLYMMGNVGWEAPFRWLGLIGLLAYVADYYINQVPTITETNEEK